MKKIDAHQKRVVSKWQILSVSLLYITLVLTLLMVVLAVVDNAFNLFSYGSFMFVLYERLIGPSSLISFYLPVLVCSFLPEYLWFNVAVTVICVFSLARIGYLTLNIFRANAKTVVRVWIVIMIFESLISFVLIFEDLFSVFILVYRVFTVFSLFMSLKFINSHYEFYDY
ncbi:MAG: hypothetical protein IJ433_05340 [Ruminococcus sp.]|nr:hypothetical protein [Ruminococcus sp.]